MQLEKKEANVQWFKEDNLRLRVQTDGENSIVSVNLDGYNIGLTLAMYDFIDWAELEWLIDVEYERDWINHTGFMINAEDVVHLIVYIPYFIEKWNLAVKKKEKPLSERHRVTDEVWYGCESETTGLQQ